MTYPQKSGGFLLLYVFCVWENASCKVCLCSGAKMPCFRAWG
ncbi:hypothetical protein HMPREF9997_00312 [Corynebacterium durum F0235]|uniref:Uncharacterized protein n=1 Tax=Corynebacterium durum F0235 TaxID=1035195 RepID=L1MM38_9CORY|nr:hypothetical protein HMPREF9997_00312 [Corynebacterium durum F0235]